MEGYYKKDSKLDFGMYKGYELGVVFIFDPGYINWCINNIDTFCVTDLEELKDYSIINENLNWQYRMIGDPSVIPYIDVFETFQEYCENVRFGDKKFIFSEDTLKKNRDKLMRKREGFKIKIKIKSKLR